MGTAEQRTCGQGLAENSVLPAKVGHLLSAMAENLAVHKKALDLTDPNSHAEYDAYEGLVRELQQIASHLDQVADHMAGYRDLPMGVHDEQAMAHPIVHATFKTFVNYKRELLRLLERTREQDDKLLEIMQAHSR